ncbi:DNA-directed RNA polymerase subunit beta [Sediminibacillus massiliensis]|uniref:DNA-directed RNA polymerase subunit beta n=1 Tax=Sediminibacillus massiliensis TaxID=1926277 RepID=UPI0009884198|nr:DNA-directed RNA polymerase subunit beta [Sediminibacillus massiliensis]
MPTTNQSKEPKQTPTKRSEQKKLQKQEKKNAKNSTDTSEEKDQRKAAKQEKKKLRRRIFPIWLRIIVVLVLCALALILGLMFGYGVLGDGNPTDALEKDTWQHILEIVRGPQE